LGKKLAAKIRELGYCEVISSPFQHILRGMRDFPD